MTPSELGELLVEQPSVTVDALAGGRFALNVPVAPNGRGLAVRLEMLSRHISFGSLACADGTVWIRYTAALAAVTPDRLRVAMGLLVAEAGKLARVLESGYFLV